MYLAKPQSTQRKEKRRSKRSRLKANHENTKKRKHPGEMATSAGFHRAGEKEISLAEPQSTQRKEKK